MAKKKETALQQRIRRELKKAVGGKWFKVHGSSFQEAGQGDIHGATKYAKGFYFHFEVKVPNEGKPSPLQVVTLAEWREEGVIACIVESPAQAISLVKAAALSSGKRRSGRKLYKWICLTLRAAHGEDLGYGRNPVRKGSRRRPARWAQNQLKEYLGKVPNGETWPLYGMP